MEEAQRKAAILIEALPYIRSFRNKVVAIKLGGSTMDKPEMLDSLFQDVALMASVGMRPIVVHGGGPAISREMQKRGKRPVFVHGHRVTDDETLEIARHVLVNVINADLVRRLSELGVEARTIYGDPIQARRKILEVKDESGISKQVDLGRVGVVERVDEVFFRALLNGHIVPVVSPIARGPEGTLLNVNADTVAAFLGGKLGAEKMVFLSDVHGIMTRPPDPASFADTLEEAEVRKLIADGIISGGMLPKVEGCIAALDAGVRKAHIVDGRMRHSLLLEIFTREGAGTQIVKNKTANG
jgi:acetylglutamate kinase